MYAPHSFTGMHRACPRMTSLDAVVTLGGREGLSPRAAEFRPSQP